jgi:hypothetical protein
VSSGDEVKAEVEHAEAVLKEDLARIRTPERVSLRIAVVIGLVCALFGFILGHLHR